MGNYEHGSSKKKKRRPKFEFEEKEVKTPSCPVVIMKGHPVECLKRECLWWDATKDVCKVLEK